MQDGIGQMGAGDSDMRIAGSDLQHNRQKRSGNQAEHTTPVSQMDVHEALMRELETHKEGRQVRLDHLGQHYKR